MKGAVNLEGLFSLEKKTNKKKAPRKADPLPSISNWKQTAFSGEKMTEAAVGRFLVHQSHQ